MPKGVYPRTAIHKRILSKALKGRKTWNKGVRGRYKVSAKTKEKLHRAFFKTGKVKDGDGYIRVLDKQHPNAQTKGYVFEHRIIVEKVIGRNLHRWEVVHHINGIKADNRISNLMVLNGHGVHRRLEKNKVLTPSDVIFDGSKKESNG